MAGAEGPRGYSPEVTQFIHEQWVAQPFAERYVNIEPIVRSAAALSDVFFAEPRIPLTVSGFDEPIEKVAVKFARLDPYYASASISRLVRETDIGQRLRNLSEQPFLLPIIDIVFDPDKGLGIVTPFMKQGTLADNSESFAGMPGRVAEVMMQVALALDHLAKEDGIVHRDIKPKNIFVQDTEGDQQDAVHVRLGDYGFSAPLSYLGLPQRAEDHGSLPPVDPNNAMWMWERRGTSPGNIVATPAYTAPEVAVGGTASTQSDLYALGVVAYELLSGQRYVPASGWMTAEDRSSYQLLYHVDTPPPAYVPGMTIQDNDFRRKELSQIIITLLQKGKKDRGRAKIGGGFLSFRQAVDVSTPCSLAVALLGIAKQMQSPLLSTQAFQMAEKLASDHSR